MMPTFYFEGDWIIEDCWTYKFRPPVRGELIVAPAPYDRTREICKRVIGIEGDIICVDPTGERAPSDEHVVVPKNHVWIMGDSAPWSYDSRDYGPLSISMIRGRIIAKVCFPWSIWAIILRPWWLQYRPWTSWTLFRDPYKYMSVEDGSPLWQSYYLPTTLSISSPSQSIIHTTASTGQNSMNIHPGHLAQI